MKNYLYVELTRDQAGESIDQEIAPDEWESFTVWLRQFVSNNTQSELPNVISSALEDFDQVENWQPSQARQTFWNSLQELEDKSWFKVIEDSVRILHTRDEIDSITGQVLSDQQWDSVADAILAMYEDYTFADDLTQYLEN